MNTYTEKMKELAQQTHGVKTIHYFPGLDMRNGHAGLSDIARKKGVDVANLKAGEFMVFSNRKQTHLKLLGPNQVLVHLKTLDSQKIEMEALQLLPRLFNGTQFNVAKAAQIGLLKAA